MHQYRLDITVRGRGQVLSMVTLFLASLSRMTDSSGLLWRQSVPGSSPLPRLWVRRFCIVIAPPELHTMHPLFGSAAWAHFWHCYCCLELSTNLPSLHHIPRELTLSWYPPPIAHSCHGPYCDPLSAPTHNWHRGSLRGTAINCD